MSSICFNPYIKKKNIGAFRILIFFHKICSFHLEAINSLRVFCNSSFFNISGLCLNVHFNTGVAQIKNGVNLFHICIIKLSQADSGAVREACRVVH